ncbi:similar to Saccharomyces cerevisiae YPL066W Putative protein of unknown function [Maudiozyma barnettii]|uniref:Arrestin C-terminal-like domain-containing protein n=1 Tax=Maudiozyma barnettii TaxID=61262 RepID=A0A8H2VHT7_9SACH|nr:Rgl1p [Kazachstania barnettii]CAB4255815.1 similar to Saccharomyces cerevisiae YPL066W Putative protein of unknown function [Kazachstania barnettii]CAD1784376.1 similar to Saccharomyces cerevisiae YPL066W Putative protein of unknown function [Kazachstania barnettii]
MTAYPVISLKPSYNSVIRGCPGIPDTLPRIECQLQIKSNNGDKINIERIEIILKTVEVLHSTNSISLPSPSSVTSPFESTFRENNNDNDHHLFQSGNKNNHDFSSSNSLLSRNKKKKNKFELITVHYKKIINLKTNTKKSMIGLDLPLTIALPDNIKETNYNEKFGNCVTTFECIVQYDSKHVKHFSHLINVERFSLLPSIKLFPEIKRRVISPDKKYIVKYRIDNPCVTTDDLLSLVIDFKPDPSVNGYPVQNKGSFFNKKVKLKNITFQLKEVLQINDSTNANATHTHHHLVNHPHLPHNIESKENIIHTFTKDINEVISTNTIHVKYDMRIFTKDKFFRNFERTSQEPEFLYKLPKNINESNNQGEVKTLLIQSKNKNIPFQYHGSITTHGPFFSVLHYLTIKFKISNGKDFEISQNISVTKWPKSYVKYIEQLIAQESQTAQYARSFYDNYGGIITKKVDHTGFGTDDSKRIYSHSEPSLTNSNIILEYPILPPSIYYHDEDTLKKFNILSDRSDKKIRRIPIIE